MTFLGLSVLAVRASENAEKKLKTKPRKGYISRMCGGATVQPIVIILGTARDTADVITPAKFGIDGFKGFGLIRGQILESPIGNRNGPYHCV